MPNTKNARGKIGAVTLMLGSFVLGGVAFQGIQANAAETESQHFRPDRGEERDFEGTRRGRQPDFSQDRRNFRRDPRFRGGDHQTKPDRRFRSRRDFGRQDGRFEKEIRKTEDGVEFSIRSNDPEVIEFLHQRAERMQERLNQR